MSVLIYSFIHSLIYSFQTTILKTAFISIVGVLNETHEVRNLERNLLELGKNLFNHFQNYEILLVNNLKGIAPDAEISRLPISIKKHIHLLNLSGRCNRNHAILAGLDRANGDYTIILEFSFFSGGTPTEQNFEILLNLFEKTTEGFDLVYLRTKDSDFKKSTSLSRKWFYFILKNWSNLQVDPNALDTRIISRRALNSLLRLRENLRYMKPVYSIIGYKTAFLEIENPNPKQYKSEEFSEQFKTSLVAISSFTTFLRSVSLWIFVFSIIAVLAVIINAFKVKFTGYDLFGIYHEALSGWAFTVVIISVFFCITSLNLFIVSIYLSNIYFEIKKRPLYILESVVRF